jgi:hypothetical protein
MGLKSGDKARHYRQQRQRNLRRMEMRALRATLEKQAAAAPKAASKSA